MKKSYELILTPEGFQTLLRKSVESDDMEANALVGVYNQHKQIMEIVPHWECDYPEELPVMLADMLASFADKSGSGDCIGAFAFIPIE